MATPIINIVSTTGTRIGASTGKDVITVTFTSSQDLVAWEARVDGTTGQGSGQYVGGSQSIALFQSLDLMLWDQLDTKTWSDSGPSDTKDFGFMSEIVWDQVDGFLWDDFLFVIRAGVQYTFTIDNEELQWGDKAYRVDIYGMNEAGEWTPYGG